MQHRRTEFVSRGTHDMARRTWGANNRPSMTVARRLAVLAVSAYFLTTHRCVLERQSARMIMGIEALGYIGVRAKTLDDWASYGEKLLGLQRIDKSRTSLAFRMDDRKQRLVIDADGGQGIAFFGWEVADAAALDKVAARIEAAGTKVARGSRALAGERHVTDLIVLSDPGGNRLGIFHGAQSATASFKPGRNISGVRTGPLGMGHVVRHFCRMAEVIAFYQNLLEF